MPSLRRLAVMALPALLAACGGDAPADDRRSASGEVLEGTISDEMLPLDTVQSQPPLAAPTRRGPGGGAGADADDAASSAAEDGAAPTDAASGDAAPAVPAPAAE